MDIVFDWFNSMDSTQKVYWGIAIFFSLFFLLQNVMTLIGIGDMDSSADVGDVDMPDTNLGMDGHDGTLGAGGASQLFTLRNMVNFMLGFGWGGACFFHTISHPMLLFLVAGLCGLCFLAIFLFLFRQLMKLESNGTMRIQDCVGMGCDVYLRIPAHREGMGKVQISIHGSVQELPAMTDGEKLSSGTRVTVVEVIDGHTLLVSQNS